MSEADKDGWIEWHGGECPVSPDTVVDWRLRSGYVAGAERACRAIYLHWDHHKTRLESDILAYRIVSQPEQPTHAEGWKPAEPSGSKYRRGVMGALPDGTVDVYSVLLTFAVTCPARQHAVKKLLCAGLRGKGDELQDLREARDAIDRAIQIAEGGK
jgi:hypothetical protein